MSLKQNQFATDDRRRHTRYQLSVPIQLSMTDRPAIEGLTMEISEGGIRGSGQCLIGGRQSNGCYTNRVQRDVGRGKVDSRESIWLRIPRAKLGTTAEDQRPLPQAAVALQQLGFLATRRAFSKRLVPGP